MPTQTKARSAQPPSRAVDWTPRTEDTSVLDNRWLRRLREQGQPISPHAAQLQSEIRTVEVRVFGNWTMWASASLTDERGRQRFRDRLHASLEAEPLEDGMDHPAESAIAAALDSEDSDTVLRWIRSTCLDTSSPAFAAAVFVCVGSSAGSRHCQVARGIGSLWARRGRRGGARRRHAGGGGTGLTRACCMCSRPTQSRSRGSTSTVEA